MLKGFNFSLSRGMSRIGVATAFILAAGPALAFPAKSYFERWNYSQEQFGALPALKQLGLHNRCIVAATYAMIDSRFTVREAKSVYLFHIMRADSLTRTAPYGQRTLWNQKAGSVQANKEVYKSLGWTRVLKATIESEMTSCSELSRIL